MDCWRRGLPTASARKGASLQKAFGSGTEQSADSRPFANPLKNGIPSSKMASSITGYRIFIATPGGLHAERKAFRATVHDYNETDAIQRGVLFIPVGWEDTLAGAGRPQGIIDEDLTLCDYFILVVWDRWGTPPDQIGKGKYTSGTQEEFFVAEACYKDPQHPMRQLTAFFKAVDPRKLSDPGDQLIKVLDFKRELESSKRLLFSTFDEVSEFEQQLRRHLAKWVRQHEQGKTGKVVSPLSQPSMEAIQAIMPVNISTSDVLPRLDGERNQLLVKAEQFANQGHLTEAETLYARAIARGNDPDAFNAYGTLLQRLGRLSQAQVMYERVLELAGGGGECWKGIAYGNLGELYRTRGDLDMAEKMHKRALEIDERLGRKEGMAIQYGKLGRIYRRRGDLDAAEAMHRKALDLNTDLGNLQGTAVDYGDLAQVFRHRNELDEALTYLHRALEINENLKLQLGIAIVCGNLGLVYRQKGALDLAEMMHRRSLEIDERLGHQEGMAIQYGNLGLVYLSRGEFDEAERLLRTSLAINERLGREEGIAGDHRDLGSVHQARGDITAATAYWAKARDRFLLIGMPHEVTQLDSVLTGLGGRAAHV